MRPGALCHEGDDPRAGRLVEPGVHGIGDQGGQVGQWAGFDLGPRGRVTGAETARIGSEEKDAGCGRPVGRAEIDGRQGLDQAGIQPEAPTDSTPGCFGRGDPSGAMSMTPACISNSRR